MDFREIYILGLDKKDLSLKDKSIEEWISILDDIEFSDSDKDENVVRIVSAVIKAINKTYDGIRHRYPGIPCPTNFNNNILKVGESGIPHYIYKGSVKFVSVSSALGPHYTTDVSISWLKYLIKNVDRFEQYMKDTYIQKSNKEIERLKNSIEKIKNTINES